MAAARAFRVFEEEQMSAMVAMEDLHIRMDSGISFNSVVLRSLPSFPVMTI